MSKLENVLELIIENNGLFVTKEGAEECLKELRHLESELNVAKLVIKEIKIITKECLEIYGYKVQDKNINELVDKSLKERKKNEQSV